jgi:2-polyprenyl-3-methyl-5-hydroxy-6-metoxy-1,4-benzoquinol methylase
LQVRPVKQTDKHWENFGKADPYFGVLSDARFKKESLDEEKLNEFFKSGEEFVQRIFEKIRSKITPDFAPSKTLDFGCGVGRLAIPLARRCGVVHGIDVSPSMLLEAKKNAEKRGVTNIRFFESDDALSAVGDGYDLITSFFVLQHIPIKRGLEILKQLLNRLANNGILALEVPYHTGRTPIRGAVSKIRRYVPWAHYAANLLEGNRLTYPHMEMNVYPLPDITRILYENGVRDLVVELGRDPMYYTAALIGQKEV